MYLQKTSQGGGGTVSHEGRSSHSRLGRSADPGSPRVGRGAAPGAHLMGTHGGAHGTGAKGWTHGTGHMGTRDGACRMQHTQDGHTEQPHIQRATQKGTHGIGHAHGGAHGRAHARVGWAGSRGEPSMKPGNVGKWAYFG